MCSKTCNHRWATLKSRTILIYWACQMCHTGPHMWVYKCLVCGRKICRQCSIKHWNFDRTLHAGKHFLKLRLWYAHWFLHSGHFIVSVTIARSRFLWQALLGMMMKRLCGMRWNGLATRIFWKTHSFTFLLFRAVLRVVWGQASMGRGTCIL